MGSYIGLTMKSKILQVWNARRMTYYFLKKDRLWLNVVLHMATKKGGVMGRTQQLVMLAR